jgi:hypothetical protein
MGRLEGKSYLGLQVQLLLQIFTAGSLDSKLSIGNVLIDWHIRP